MADVHSPETRSYNMSRIRSRNTKPESQVQKYLFSRGLRYRKNDTRYPGHPDMVFPKYRTVVFVNGCFWHMHEGCTEFVFPKSNQEFWGQKLHRNRQRDAENIKSLEENGWRVIVVWGCELKKKVLKARLEQLYAQITGYGEKFAGEDKENDSERGILNE